MKKTDTDSHSDPVNGPNDAGRPRPGQKAMIGIFVLAVLYTIYFARIFLMPLAFALLLAILLHPLVRRLNRLKVPDAVGAGMVVVMLVALVGAGIYYLSGPAAKWLDQGPYLLKTMEFKVSGFKQSLDEARQATRQLEEMADLGKKDEVVVKESSLAEKIFSQVQSFSSTALIILVLLYFMLAHGWRILARLSPDDSQSAGRAYRLVVQIQNELSGYLLTVTLINACLGGLTAVAMTLFGLPNPILWGVVAALLNFVPYVGAAVTLLIISMVSLLSFDAWGRILWPPVVFFLLTVLEGHFITPSILGRNLTLNPLVVLVSILFWGWAWGIVGAILGVPILTAFMVAAKNVDPLRPIGKILG